MKTNQIPKYDIYDKPTGCCPKFNPEGWDGQNLHFKDKLFVKVKTRSLFHIPINMGKVFPKTFAQIEKAQALDENDCIVLSYDPSPWTGEHYFSVKHEVAGLENIRLSGDYYTKVFEGPYKNVPKWEKQLRQIVEKQMKKAKKVYFFYTTCPKCAKVYGKNYLVALAQTS